MYEFMENKKDFLQSNEWRKFQEAVGRKTFCVTSPQPSPYKGEGVVEFSASIIEHSLPIVGRYFYIPKGPVILAKAGIQSLKLDSGSKAGMTQLFDLAKKEKAGWIRIEPENEEILKMIKNFVEVRFIEPKAGFNKLNPYKKLQKYKIIKSPHDMQPKETLIMDISKSEEEILAEMKSKTRYNIKLAQKHNVLVREITNYKLQITNKSQNPNDQISKQYIEEFLRLTKIMSERQGIVTHGENYYRKMLEIIPESIIKLYVAEYENKIIATNIVIFYGDTAYYLHGASDDKYKNLMAPHMLQWRQIQDARKAGCVRYDFCGVKVNEKKGKSWEGITRFKLGFSPNTKPVEFPGSYDIIVSPVRYWGYRIIQKIKNYKN